ncbi:hypothetical protein V5O48_009217 [Marasmius crinis-equi]|uniref:Hydrophobin n=1 Tax=Marasmius crinis-equi TaxID=585013 RepID=A0ABR3FBU5_9AGAR
MFSRLAVVTFLTSALFVAAAPQGGDVCSSGTVQCCNSVQSSDSPEVQGVLGSLVGVVIGDITPQVGLTCTPISVLGEGGNSCTSQTACCVGNTFEGGRAVMGCNNISL